MPDETEQSIAAEIYDLGDQEALEFVLRTVGKKVSAEFLNLLAELNLRLGFSFRIGIVTALQCESNAVKAVFGGSNCTQIPTSALTPVRYYSVTAPCTIKGCADHEVVLCRTSDMGNNAAAVAATSMFKDFSTLEGIVMVGIAGGLPKPIRLEDGDTEKYDDHVRLGDIIVTDRDGVIQYDMIKREKHKDQVRARMRPTWALLYDVSRDLVEGQSRSRRPWQKFIDAHAGDEQFSRPASETDQVHDHDGKTVLDHPKQKYRVCGQPLAHQGRIGSANILLKNSRQRDKLRRNLQVIGVEMEGSGIADAAWNFNRGYIVVRGICDYCDMKKVNLWQGYAALVAAAFTRTLIERLPARLKLPSQETR